MQPEDINVVYKSDTRDRRFPPRKNFINRFLDYTTGKQINFRHFYKTVFGMKPSHTDVTTFGDAAKLLISWFATYLLLNAFGMKFLCTQMYRRNKCFKLNIDNLCCVDYCFSWTPWHYQIIDAVKFSRTPLCQQRTSWCSFLLLNFPRHRIWKLRADEPGGVQKCKIFAKAFRWAQLQLYLPCHNYNRNQPVKVLWNSIIYYCAYISKCKILSL